MPLGLAGGAAVPLGLAGGAAVPLCLESNQDVL